MKDTDLYPETDFREEDLLSQGISEGRLQTRNCRFGAFSLSRDPGIKLVLIP